MYRLYLTELKMKFHGSKIGLPDILWDNHRLIYFMFLCTGEAFQDGPL
jgi:hypothetical protein